MGPRQSIRWYVATAVAAASLALLPSGSGDLALVAWGFVCAGYVLRAGWPVHRRGSARVAAARRGRVWLFVGISLVFTAAGDATWFWLDYVADADPFPSVGDVFYLAAYPFVVAALVTLTRRELVHRDPGDAVDAGIVVAGASALALVMVVDPFVQAGGSLLAVVVRIAYPLADILVLGYLLRLVFARDARARGPVRLLAAGAVAMMAADVGFVVGETNGWVGVGQVLEIGWPVWFGLVAAAASADLGASSASVADAVPPAVGGNRMPPSRLLLLAVATLMAPATLVLRSAVGESAQTTTLGIVSMAAFGLVLLRMAGLMRAVQAQADLMARLSEIDPLTGLANRRVWERELQATLAMAKSTGRPLAVAMLDVDRFKAFNDTLGHAAGDHLLEQAAAAWTVNLRAGDLLVRIGGEEFALLLRDVGLEEATQITDRLRRACPPIATCSAGVAALEGDETAAALVERADQALFAAKREGRDRTVARVLLDAGSH